MAMSPCWELLVLCSYIYFILKYFPHAALNKLCLRVLLCASHPSDGIVVRTFKCDVPTAVAVAVCSSAILK